MDRPVRIAVVGSIDEKLIGELRKLPLQPEVRPVASLLDDTEVLMRFQPELLLVQFDTSPDEDIGAVRLLQRLWPTIRVGIISTTADEIASGSIASRLSAQLIVYPNTPGHLAAVLEQMLHGGDRPRPEHFVDLAHGMADEINNPLLFVSGHLQLLRASMNNPTETRRRDQIDAAMKGLKRIEAAVDRLRFLSQSADGPRQTEAVDLANLLADSVSQRHHDSEAASVTIPPGPQMVQGDREQLGLAIAAVVEFADELAQAVDECHLQLSATNCAQRLRVTARGKGLATWQLPKTFEPFYPQRLLRGQSHGLGLLLAQTVVQGHGGQATVCRLRDGALQLDFLLPG